MKKQLLLSCYFLLCVAFGSIGQRYQVTNGTGTPDIYWGIVDDPALNRFVTIGNTLVNGQSRLWITSSLRNGTLVTSNTLTNGRRMEARDISLAPLYNGNPSYYVTGYTEFFNTRIVRQMFVARIDVNGAFIWYQENPFNGQGNDKEGISIVTAPNGDAVALGVIAQNPAAPMPGTSWQVYIARFNPFGALAWGNQFNVAGPGNWMPRKINNGVAPPGFVPASVDNYVVTGEVQNLNANPVTFVAVYTGAGFEAWRNLYPVAAATPFANTGDAGYDVVYEPVTNNYCIAGAAETNNGGRAAATSTPYVLAVAPGGALFAAAIYVTPAQQPLGLFPRTVALGINTRQLVFAGPNYTNNRVFWSMLPTLNVVLPGFVLGDFQGLGTANNAPPMLPNWLNNAPPENIITSPAIPAPGYAISANATLGAFGNGDGHLIKTDQGGRTPDSCGYRQIINGIITSNSRTPVSHTRVSNTAWGNVVPVRASYPVNQQFCRDTCIVKAGYTYSQTGTTVDFTNTSSGNGASITYSWNFGDPASGPNNTSTAVNPSHIYVGTDPYFVACLTVTNINFSGDTCKAIFCDTIRISCCKAKSDFCLSLNGTQATLNINTSVNPPGTIYTVYENGSPVSWPNNTIRTLTSPNIYTICVKATAIACGDTCCATDCKIIRPSDSCTVSGDFSYTVDPGGQVSFNSTATGFTNDWDFGDGGGSNVINPIHNYSTPGTYTVCLTISNVVGTDTCRKKVCKTIVIDEVCDVTAHFRTGYCVDNPLTVLFTNLSGGAASYVWNFGDPSSGANNTSTATNPTHDFSAPGVYVVCLQAVVDADCWYTACYTVIVSDVMHNTDCDNLPTAKQTVMRENKVTLLNAANAKGIVTSKPEAITAVQKEGLLLFPNPASQKVQAQFAAVANGNAEVWVLNSQGTVVFKKLVPVNKGGNQLTIPVGGLPAGLYHVTVKTSDKQQRNHFMVNN